MPSMNELIRDFMTHGSQAAAGAECVRIRPGAGSPAGLRKAEALGLKVIANAPCNLVLAHSHDA